jgi:hypothetical protein
VETTIGLIQRIQCHYQPRNGGNYRANPGQETAQRFPPVLRTFCHVPLPFQKSDGHSLMARRNFAEIYHLPIVNRIGLPDCIEGTVPAYSRTRPCRPFDHLALRRIGVPAKVPATRGELRGTTSTQATVWRTPSAALASLVVIWQCSEQTEFYEGVCLHGGLVPADPLGGDFAWAV